jgi:hypothetical protein
MAKRLQTLELVPCQCCWLEVVVEEMVVIQDLTVQAQGHLPRPDT